MRFCPIVATVTYCFWTQLAWAQVKPSERPVRKITADTAVTEALKNNLSIALTRVQRDMVAYDLQAAYGVYDPTFSITASHSDASSVSQFNSGSGVNQIGSTSQYDSVQQSISGYAPTGLRYNVGVSFAHSFGDRGATSFDDYTARVGVFQLDQPLLRNLWIDSNRATLKISKLNRSASNLDLEYQVMTVVRAVYRAYYDLIYSEEQVTISLSAHELAAQLARDIKREVEVGKRAPLEERQAESQSQTEYGNYIEAVQNRNTVENRLKDLMTNRYKEAYESRIEPAEKLLPVGRDVDLQESWKNGLALRPDFRRKFLETEMRGVDLRFAKNQMFPGLDLFGTYARNGLDSGGPFNDATIEGAFHDIRRNSQPSRSIGVVLSVPFALQRERGNLHKARAAREQVLLQLAQTEQSVLVGIDDAVGAVRGSLIRIKVRRLAREAAEEALSAEQKKLANGVVAPSEVLRKQQDLTRARSQEVQAILDYNQALSELEFQDGTILHRNNIEIQPAK